MTTFVSVDLFIDELATRVSGAPVNVLQQELKATLRDFYVWTNSFVILTPGIDIVAGQDEYALNPQVDGNVLTVFAVKVEDTFVPFYGTETPGTIKLANSPTVSVIGGLTAYVALKPLDYASIPDVTVTYDFDTILDGATGRLFSMPDRPWSNLPSASLYLQRYKIGSGRARVRTRSRYTTAEAGFKFPSW
jgi:hypothetical protein